MSILIASIAMVPAVTASIETNFTYQGQLKSGGSPVDGQYDMQFALFDAGANGNQIGPTITFNDMDIAAGLFTVQLDFGDVFDGSDRWLEIRVRPGASNDAYSTLSPRQPLTATPYALFALNSGDAGATTLDEAYDGGGSGAGRSITADAGAVNIAGSGGLTVNGSVGIATTSPGAKLHVSAADSNGLALNVTDNLFVRSGKNFVGVNRSTQETAAEFFGVHAAVGDGSYGGMYLTTEGNGLPFYGYSTSDETCWTYLDGPDATWRIFIGGADRFNLTDAGDVAIGKTTPSTRLDVKATAGDCISGVTTAASSIGVYGSGTTAGVKGESGASNGFGVYGRNGTDGGEGVRGSAGDGGGAGVAGYGNFGTGVYGQTAVGYGVFGSNGGSNDDGYAGYFNGRVHVNGKLSKSSGSFRIDHPLDPADKYLSHSFVESPDMMNVYNGNVVLNDAGESVVEMPEWFEALNKDFRYQLTCIGGFAPVYVAQEVDGNQFKIAGGKAGLKVSWQVTGIRHDAYADANPMVVEEPKTGDERGKYLHPELYGLSGEYQIGRPHGTVIIQSDE
jgi:hypothetical protein